MLEDHTWKMKPLSTLLGFAFSCKHLQLEIKFLLLYLNSLVLNYLAWRILVLKRDTWKEFVISS